MKVYDSVDPSEEGVLVPDFVLRLAVGESLVAASILEVTVSGGSDPSALTRFGAPTISGTTLLIPFAGLVDGCTYFGRVSVTTTNAFNTPVWGFKLPCQVASQAP